jgi:hypothetical protein
VNPGAVLKSCLLFGRSGFSKTTAVPTPHVVQLFYKAKAFLVNVWQNSFM